MKKRHLKTTASVAAALAAMLLASPSILAQTDLIDEDFDNPGGGVGNNSWIDGTTTAYTGWNWGGTGNIWQIKSSGGDGVPVSGGFALKMAWYGSGTEAEYDTSHTWASGDSFMLSLNATEQNWGDTNDRNLTVALVETVRDGGGNLTGTTVWSQTQALVRDTNHDNPPEGWGANNTFSWTFDTDDFTGGTEGSGLTLVLGGSGGRGHQIDNVKLTLDPPGDTTPPGIASFDPANEAIDIPIDADLVATFDESIKAGTGNILIKEFVGDATVHTLDVTGSDVTISGRDLTINPPSTLANGVRYYVEIPGTAVLDLSDNAFAGFTGNGTWSFTTIPADVTAPGLDTLDPFNTETNIAVDANLVANFNEDIKAGTGNILIRAFDGDAIVQTIDVAGGDVTITGGELTIDLPSDLAAGTQYYIEIPSGVILDLADNPYAGFTGNSTWSFTTVPADTTPPVLDILDPFNGETGVAEDVSPLIGFDEFVQLGTGNILIKEVVGDATFQTIDVAGGAVTIVDGWDVVIDLPTDLTAGVQYYIEIPNGAILDLAGNAYAGFSGSSTWSFTTVPPDIMAPDPDPMTWVAVPAVANYVNVSMTATPATDDSGVQYLFENTVALTSSGWQDSNTWEETGLAENTLYTYRVKARDKSSNQNETDWSSEESVTTGAVPEGLLIDENFDSPGGGLGNNSWIDGNTTAYPGWNWGGTGNIWQIKSSGQDGVPVSGGFALKMAWYGSVDAEYDTSHTWSAGDEFTLSLNATEQNWGDTNDRNLTVALVETVRDGGGNLTGTTVWSQTQALVRDTDHDNPPEGWGTHNSFSWTFDTNDFTGGTEGSGLTLVLGGSGARGHQIDNVMLTVSDGGGGGNDFSDWIAGYSVGGQTGIDQDPDGDGVDSGVENYFGTAPDAFTQGLVSAGADPGAGTFTFTHPQGTLADDLTATYRWSVDLDNFFADGVADGGVQVDFVATPDTPSPGTTTVVVTVTGPVPEKLFADVLVTQP